MKTTEHTLHSPRQDLFPSQRKRSAYKLRREFPHSAVLATETCAEKPDIKIVESLMKSITNDIRDKKITAKFNNILDNIVQLYENIFENACQDLLKDMKTLSVNFNLDPEKVSQLSELHITSNDNNSGDNHWSDNFVSLLSSLRRAHLKQVGKKGTDLHGKKVFESKKTPTDNPNNVGRNRATNEVISDIAIQEHAETVIQHLQDQQIISDYNKTISIAKFVKDYSNPKQNHNIFTEFFTQKFKKSLLDIGKIKFGPEFDIRTIEIEMTTNTNRTNATAFERLFKMPTFSTEFKIDGSQIEDLSKHNILLVDDHVNNGAFMSCLASHLIDHNATIAGVSSFSRHPNSVTLNHSQFPLIKEALVEVVSEDELNNALKTVGMDIKTLSPREALTLVGIFSDPLNETHRKRFNDALKSSYISSVDVIEGIKDDLNEVFYQPKLSILDLQQQLEEGVGKNFEASQEVQKFALLSDWDDTLINSEEFYAKVYDETYKRAESEFCLQKPSKTYRDKSRNQTSSDYFKEVYGQENGGRVIELRQKILKEHCVKPALKDGAKELILKCFNDGVPFAIVSDTPQHLLTNIVKETLQIAIPELPKTYVDNMVIVGRSDEVEGKPSPDGINRALNLLSQKGKIDHNSSVLMIGDKASKDAASADRAGIMHAIIPDIRSDNLENVNTLPSLHAVSRLIQHGGNIGDVETPHFITREPYNSGQDLNIICNPKGCIESPTKDSGIDLSSFSPAELEFHEKRWIAKRAVNLDLTGKNGEQNPTTEQKYTREEQLSAANDAINGFTAKDGTEVEAMFTDQMKEEIFDKVNESIKSAREKGISPIKIHFPERVVMPRKPVENMLSVAYNTGVMKYLEDRFKDQDDVVFSEQERRLEGVSIERDVKLRHGDDFSTIGISDHEPSKTAQAGRSTGDLVTRIGKQPIFDWSSFKEGDIVVLTDDHVQAGGTFVTWYHALKQKDVDVPVITALTSMPESKQLSPKESVEDDLKTALEMSHQDHKFQKLQESIGQVGISIGTLTNREALTLMAFLIDGTDSKQLKWFEGKAKSYGVDMSIQERPGEALLEQAKKEPVSPGYIHVAINRQIPYFIPKKKSTIKSVNHM